jgi:uncharacterized protein (DUF362 family)
VRDVFAAADGPLVVQAKGGTPAQLARAVVAELGGMKAFVSPGETVVVKPNIGWDRKPEQAANTNPELVCEVVRMCLEAGAAKVKVFDRTCNDPRRCYVTSGIGPAVEAMNDPRVELSQVDERRFRKIDIPGATLLTSWPFYEDVLSADKYINVPIAKHHSAAVLTMGMKNILGVVGSNRAVLHRNLPEALLDLNRGLRTHLTIVDATRILTANGPQGGKLEDVTQLDTVVAGTDIVAVDSVACALFGKSPKDIRYLQMAHEQGFGVADLDRIRVKKIGV